MNATFNAIIRGVFNRLARISSRTKKHQMRISKISQGHTNALTEAGLAPKIFLSLKQFGRNQTLQNLIMTKRGKIELEDNDIVHTSM